MDKNLLKDEKNIEKKAEVLRSVRVTLSDHEYECLRAEADKEQRVMSKQVLHILIKRYKNKKENKGN